MLKREAGEPVRPPPHMGRDGSVPPEPEWDRRLGGAWQAFHFQTPERPAHPRSRLARPTRGVILRTAVQSHDAWLLDFTGWLAAAAWCRGWVPWRPSVAFHVKR
jgi:hypothetical protein